MITLNYVHLALYRSTDETRSLSAYLACRIELLSILYCIFCYFTPDLELYDWYVEKYGFVIEEDFLDYYTLILYLIAIAVTTACIWLIAIIRTKRY